MFTFPVSHWAVGFKNTYSMLFDGVDEYATFGGGTTFGFERTDPFSVSFWIKKTATGSFDIIFDKFANGANKGWVIYITSLDFLRFQLQNSAGNRVRVTGSQGLTSTAVWYHCVITYSGSSTAAGVNLYVDNVKDLTPTVNDDTLTLTTVDNTVVLNMMSNSANSDPTAAYFDEPSIWNKELSATEVSSIYNSGAPANLNSHSASANLIGWWRMGDGATFSSPNWSIPDDSTNNNTGTTTNMEEADRSTVIP